MRQENGPFKPVAPGSTASAGTRTPLSVMSHWIEARIPSLGSMGVAVKPPVPVGTTKPRIPSSVFAQMIATSAMEASPIHRFAPSITQSSPSRTAVVTMLAGSLPAVGSVSPKQPIRSPAAMPGSQRCFCSSEPNLPIALIASEPCTLTNVRRPESPASSSMAARPYSTALRPAHPYPFRCMPSRPSAPISLTISRGKCAASYQLAIFGRIRSATNARTRSRRASSSAENRVSRPR